MKLIRKNTIMIICAAMLLASCEEQSTTLYLFGPANSCFPSRDPGSCDKLKLYDRLTIAVSAQRQEINFVQEGVRLDSSNVIYRKLEGCKIIDRHNFSCNEFSFLKGELHNHSIFKDLVATKSYWAYLLSYYTQVEFGRSKLIFLDRNDSWITPVVWVFGAIIVLGILGVLGNA
jgi:hypothetical protein